MGILLIFTGVYLISQGRMKTKMAPKDVEAHLVDSNSNHSGSEPESPTQ